jgi:hypothetical protein
MPRRCHLDLPLVSRLLLVVSILGLVFSLYAAKFQKPLADETHFAHLTRLPRPASYEIVTPLQNPDPPHHAADDVPTYSQLYIAVMDTAYSPAKYHCLMKKQWMDGFAELPNVDGVECYSITALEDEDCDSQFANCRS